METKEELKSDEYYRELSSSFNNATSADIINALRRLASLHLEE